MGSSRSEYHQQRVEMGSTSSYLAPILRTVGITEPVKITLINAGLGELQPEQGAEKTYSLFSILESHTCHGRRRQCRQVWKTTSVLDELRWNVLLLRHHHGAVRRICRHEGFGHGQCSVSPPVV